MIDRLSKALLDSIIIKHTIERETEREKERERMFCDKTTESSLLDHVYHLVS